MRVFKNKWVVFLVSIIILVLVIMFSFGPGGPFSFVYSIVSVPLRPVQSFFSGASRRISGAVSFMINYGEDDELELLREEVESLRDGNRNVERYREELEELRTLLDISGANDEHTYVAANVIAYDTMDWFNVFSINRGSMAGVELYDVVITGRGLVGKVIEVAPTSAKVMSLADERSNLIGRLSKTNDIVRISGMENRSSEILLRMDRIGETVDIAVGDTVETAETGGVFPKGIVIGRVKEIIQRPGSRYALIEPAVDFRRMDVVMVIGVSRDG